MAVVSELGRLQRVIVKRPGHALDRMLPAHIHPDSPQYMLFDDLVDVPEAQQEHAQLTRVLASAAEVGQLDDLLCAVLQLPAARDQILAGLERVEQLPPGLHPRLDALEPEGLALALVAGFIGDERVLSPLPNLLFTRDLAAVVGQRLVVGRASKAARRRESLLMWALVDHHPWFADLRLSRWSEPAARGPRYPLTVEGGDVLVISPELVMVGASERTSWSMIINLAQELLFGEGSEVGTVLVIEMPRQRASMHLDTVFTLVDTEQAAVYGPILRRGDPEEVHVIRLRRGRPGEVVAEDLEDDLLSALARQGHPVEPVFCGGAHPVYERREQWTDGANFVALSPGIVVGYARNRYTADAMTAAGFECVSAAAYLEHLQTAHGGDFDALCATGRRLAIHVEGSELCRGRGGPRCLSLPLARAELA